MIKFFRRIRQQLLTENKVSKYLLYAVGEIVLVVIGILIALQINNWNEDRKDHLVEQEYLKGLKEEFESNAQQLKYFTSSNDQILEATKTFLKYTGPKAESIEIPMFRKLFGSILSVNVDYESNPGVLEDLINSGNLNKITNSSLRQALSLWKSDLNKSKTQELRIRKYRDNITDLLIQYGPLRNMLNDTLHIGDSAFDIKTNLVLQDPQLENNLTYFMITSRALKYKFYKNLENDVSLIHELISKDLK